MGPSVNDGHVDWFVEEARAQLARQRDALKRANSRAVRAVQFNGIAVTVVVALIELAGHSGSVGTGPTTLRTNGVIGLGLVVIGVSILLAIFVVVLSSPGQRPPRHLLEATHTKRIDRRSVAEKYRENVENTYRRVRWAAMSTSLSVTLGFYGAVVTITEVLKQSPFNTDDEMVVETLHALGLYVLPILLLLVLAVAYRFHPDEPVEFDRFER